MGNKTGQFLFHEVASSLPIIDYHNHLNPQHIAENKQFKNLTELWIVDDPYKHRAMRINGIPESGITGNSDDKEKYYNWIETLPKTIGNPLFHWSCLELKRIFDIDELPNKNNADKIWATCNKKLTEEDFYACNIIKKWNTEILITSDEILDNLLCHKKIKSSNTGKVLPSLRGDSILDIENGNFLIWLQKLQEMTDFTIKDLKDFIACIQIRLDFFGNNGCFFADHALDSGFTFQLVKETEAEKLFMNILNGRPLEPGSMIRLKSFLLLTLGEEYAKRRWTLQLHIGAQRNTSSRLKNLAGSAGGYAGIGKGCDLTSLCLFLDSLEKKKVLPETILYTLNPADNAAMASLTGSFSEDGVIGKIQFGPAWWYNDNYEGIRTHLKDLSSIGLMSTFIGMTTDSRSILSLSRHEYFRRILCDLLGQWVEEGKIPNNVGLLEQIVRDISYFNIKNKILKKETL